MHVAAEQQQTLPGDRSFVAIAAAIASIHFQSQQMLGRVILCLQSMINATA